MGNAAAVRPSVKDGEKRSFSALYTLGDELGSGAFSIVKRGYYKKTGDNVAVKIVNKKKLSDDDLLSLQTEIQILNSLDHPNIIKLYETFDEGNEIFIITEIVEGGELFDRIVLKTNYSEKEARNLIKTLLKTLDYLADNTVVHRDMKPENILLCSDEDDTAIKIADFGFAKKLKDLTGNETPCGTPGYVAPEVLRGDRYGCEVDIWSLGVICYVLLAGYPPFYDEDQKKLFKKIKEGRFYFHDEYWSSVSKEAVDMIKKMICVNQKNRWTAKQLLQHPWILKDDEMLANKSLTEAIGTMKKFNARRRFKAAISSVMFTQKLKGLGLRASQLNNSTTPITIEIDPELAEKDYNVPDFVNKGNTPKANDTSTVADFPDTATVTNTHTNATATENTTSTGTEVATTISA